MPFSKRSFEGQIYVDHRASPGLPADFARANGLDPALVGEGSLFEAPTYTCPHCGTVVIINQRRTRERSYCKKCDNYLCDNCEAARCHPDYVHRTWLQTAILAATNGVSDG